MRNSPENFSGPPLRDRILFLLAALGSACFEPPTNHVRWNTDGGGQSCDEACYDESVRLAERDRPGVSVRPGVEDIELWACEPGSARDAEGNPIREAEVVPAGEGNCAPRADFDCQAAQADQRGQVEVTITGTSADAGVPGPTTCAEACRQQDPPLTCNFGVTPGGGRRLPSQPLQPGDTAVCFPPTPPGVQCP